MTTVVRQILLTIFINKSQVLYTPRYRYRTVGHFRYYQASQSLGIMVVGDACVFWIMGADLPPKENNRGREKRAYTKKGIAHGVRVQKIRSRMAAHIPKRASRKMREKGDFAPSFLHVLPCSKRHSFFLSPTSSSEKAREEPNNERS